MLMYRSTAKLPFSEKSLQKKKHKCGGKAFMVYINIEEPKSKGGFPVKASKKKFVGTSLDSK